MDRQLTAGERLKKLRKASGLTQEELGKMLNVGRTQVSNIEKGISELANWQAAQLSSHIGVSVAWLLTGEGKMQFVEKDKQEEYKKNYDREMLNALKAKSSDLGISLGKKIVSAESIPLYDIDINAGNVERLIEGSTNIPLIGFIYLEDTSAAIGLIGVRARGDSMASFINGGDVMLIKKIEDREFVPPGHAYVVISNELSVVKYIRNGSTSDKWVLRSHNDFYEDFEVRKEAVKHLFIVVKVLKEL